MEYYNPESESERCNCGPVTKKHAADRGATFAMLYGLAITMVMIFVLSVVIWCKDSLENPEPVYYYRRRYSNCAVNPCSATCEHFDLVYRDLAVMFPVWLSGFSLITYFGLFLLPWFTVFQKTAISMKLLTFVWYNVVQAHIQTILFAIVWTIALCDGTYDTVVIAIPLAFAFILYAIHMYETYCVYKFYLHVLNKEMVKEAGGRTSSDSVIS